MAPFAANLGAICYAAESSWGEDVTTFGIRLPIANQVDASGLEQSLIPTTRTVQLLNGGTFEAIGGMGGSFRTKHFLAGHGSTTSGATAATSLPTLLGYVFGGGPGSPAAGSTFTGGTATAPTTTASATFTAGQLCRGGSFGDAKGNGRFAAILSHITTTMTLLTAFDAAPTAAQVLYSAETIYASELPTSTITSLRFLLQTANMEYEAHGCWPKSVSISLPVNGELPTIEIEWGVSWWRHSTATFPSALSVDNFTPAMSGGATCSFFFQAYGTATAAYRTIRSLSVTYTMNNVPIVGPGGVNQFQTVTGCVRGPADIQLDWVEDATAATASPQSNTDFTATTASHALLTTNCAAAGQAVGVYWPNLIPTGMNGVQFSDGNVNRVKRSYKARADETRATDLLASAMRIAFA